MIFERSILQKKTSIPIELLFIYFILCLCEHAARKVRSAVIPYIKTDHFAIVFVIHLVSFGFKFHIIIIRQICFQSDFNRNRQHWRDFILYRLSQLIESWIYYWKTKVQKNETNFLINCEWKTFNIQQSTTGSQLWIIHASKRWWNLFIYFFLHCTLCIVFHSSVTKCDSTVPTSNSFIHCFEWIKWLNPNRYLFCIYICIFIGTKYAKLKTVLKRKSFKQMVEPINHPNNSNNNNNMNKIMTDHMNGLKW